MSTPLSHPFSRLRGISVLQVLITLAVLAIVALMALPSHARWRDRLQLEGRASELASDLRQARAHAMATGQPVHVRVQAQPDGATCYVVHLPDRGECSCLTQPTCENGAAPIKLGIWAGVAGRGSVVALASNVPLLSMDPGHGTVTPTATWRLRVVDGTGLNVVVNLMGRVRICSPGGSWGGHPACA